MFFEPAECGVVFFEERLVDFVRDFALGVHFLKLVHLDRDELADLA